MRWHWSSSRQYNYRIIQKIWMVLMDYFDQKTRNQACMNETFGLLYPLKSTSPYNSYALIYLSQWIYLLLAAHIVFLSSFPSKYLVLERRAWGTWWLAREDGIIFGLGVWSSSLSSRALVVAELRSFHEPSSEPALLDSIDRALSHETRLTWYFQGSSFSLLRRWQSLQEIPVIGGDSVGRFTTISYQE